MLAEFVKSLVGLVSDAQKAEIVEIPNDPRNVIIRQGTAVTYRAVPAPARAASFSSIADFCFAVSDKVVAANPEIYFDMNGAVAYLDRNDRRETINLEVHFSDQFQKILSLRNGVGLTPKEAIRLLRFELSTAGVDDLITSLRRVDFTRTNAGSSNVEHGRESFGKKVEAAVQQADTIPEQFTLRVRPARNQGLRSIEVPVTFGLAIDFEAEKVMIRPLADQLNNACEAFTGELGKLLRQSLAGVQIFEGELPEDD